MSTANGNEAAATGGTPVWFITGCSSGFGEALAQAVLGRGWCAVVTARDKSRVADLVRGCEARALALDLDVTDAAQVAAAVAAALARFGRIDVLVNNAGYGYQAAVEEGDDAPIRAMFDTNVFGLFAMTRAVLPGMRTQRRGHILNISSEPGSPIRPATEPMFRIWPRRCARMPGNTARVIANRPNTLVSNMARIGASSPSSTAAW